MLREGAVYEEEEEEATGGRCVRGEAETRKKNISPDGGKEGKTKKNIA